MNAKRRSTKVFVLDTNVLMHDPSALFRFQEHDVYIPSAVLEELDKHKAGTQDINRNARQAIRQMGELLEGGRLQEGIPLRTADAGAAGRIFFQSERVACASFAEPKADNEILAFVEHLRNKLSPRVVTLVSKDINLRVKALSSGLSAEDYLNDQAVEDADFLYKGVTYLPEDPLAHPELQSSYEDGRACYRIPQHAIPAVHLNEALVTPEGLILQVVQQDDGRALKTLAPLSKGNGVWGVHPANAEQQIALSLLMDEDIDLVTLLGPAGTGKTLLTLAAALEQTIEQKRFIEIIYTRATVPLGDDIGFLPGGEEDKMGPWLGALDDSLDILLGQRGEVDEFRKATTRELVKARIKTKAISFMRGRTFHQRFLIVDEAQNLTPKQVKALITRAGTATKIVLLGNISQIDTPYLSEGGSGLTVAVERMKNWPHFGHIILSQGERSRLATCANDRL